MRGRRRERFGGRRARWRLLSVTGAVSSGVFYADPKGVVSQHGKDVPLANGIILSPDEKTLYVTNGAVVFAFDVKPDGSLTNQREFGKLQGGQGGDGSAVDQQGRVYVATASRWTSSRRTAASSAASQGRRACTEPSSAAATRRRSSASCFMADGERRARETASSRFRRSHRVIPGERSSSSGIRRLDSISTHQALDTAVRL